MDFEPFERKAAFCCHCHELIPFETYYLTCSLCKLDYCSSCQRKHPVAHHDHVKRAIDKVVPRKAGAQPVTCVKCLETVHETISCGECSWKVCFGCYHNQNETACNDEWHKILVVRSLPDTFMGTVADKSHCKPCNEAKSMLHCGCCLKGIEVGDRLYECKTCCRRYNSTPTWCESCWKWGREMHDRSHDWSNIEYFTDSSAPSDTFAMRCLDCGQDFGDKVAATYQHPHRSWLITLGETRTLNIGYSQHRVCCKRSVKEVPGVDFTEDKGLLKSTITCACCHRHIMRDASFAMCVSGCLFACDDCVSNDRIWHEHELTICRAKRVTQQEDYWKVLAKGRQRWCDMCDETIWEGIVNYFSCLGCQNWDICGTCISQATPEKPLKLRHQNCSRNPPTFWCYDPDPWSEEWLDRQAELASEHVQRENEAAEEAERQRQAEEQRKAEQAAAAAAAAQRKRQQDEAEAARRRAAAATAARQQQSNLAVPSARPASLARAPSPSPAPGRYLAPQPQAQRRKSSSNINTSFLKGALQIGTAVLKVAAAANGGGGGGGGGGGAFVDPNMGNSFDMSGFWAPINSAASAPIQ